MRRVNRERIAFGLRGALFVNVQEFLNVKESSRKRVLERARAMKGPIFVGIEVPPGEDQERLRQELDDAAAECVGGPFYWSHMRKGVRRAR